MSNTTRHLVCAVAELPPGERKIIEVGGRSIGVFNVNGIFVAILNLCPHAFAPICRGRLTGTTGASTPGEYNWHHEGEILACPWHGWEFNLLTGKALVDKRRLHHFPLHEEDGMLYVSIGSAA